MSKSQMVSVHLPELRRYARALTGSQESGDAYVAGTVEALVNQPDLITDASTARADLFRAFSKIWNSVSVNGATAPAELLPADRRIEQLPALPRQAFLLVSLESFSEEDAAYVLDTDVTGLRELIAMDLESVVENLGHNVVGVARTRSEAIKIAQQKQPGLILADIQLADGSSGLDAVNDLLKSFTVPVVFITAYPERFLTGTRPEPAFLIAKPYKPAVVSAIVSQVLFFKRDASLQAAV